MGDPRNPETELPTVSHDFELAKKILVIGGGGKSTLARSISAKLDLTYVELDALHWLSGWVESSDEDFRAKVESALNEASGKWVVDGNYSGKIGDLVMKQADTIIWVDMPWRTMFWRMVKRSFRRARDKQRVCGDNIETWRQLLSRDALWWYHLKNRGLYNRRGERLREFLRPEIPMIRLSTSRELNDFYETNSLKRLH